MTSDLQVATLYDFAVASKKTLQTAQDKAPIKKKPLKSKVIPKKPGTKPTIATTATVPGAVVESPIPSGKR